MSDARQSVYPSPPGAAQQWPQCGVSAIVFRGREVLLVERNKGALKGRWSPPGGHIEPGERVRAAALREVREETGIEAEIRGLVDVHEVLLRGDDGQLTAHYLLAVFWGHWQAGEPVAGSDAVSARFVALEGLAAYPLTEAADSLIRRAHRLAERADRA